MKNRFKLTLLLALAIVANLNAQKVSFDDVLTIELKNMGSIIKNNEVTGYFMFYKVDKVDRKNNAYLLRILDANLNEVSSDKITESKYFSLKEASYDGQSILLKFFDLKDKQVVFYQYDQNAKVKMKKTFPLSKQEIQMASMQNSEEIKSFSLFDLENKGFLNYSVVKNKDLGYEIRFFPEAGEKGWVYKSNPESKNYDVASYLAANDQVVFSAISSRPGVMSKKITYMLLGVDLNTGKKVFEKPLVDSKYKLQVMNGYTDETSGNIVLFGLYYDDDEKIGKDQSNGLFAVTLDNKGEYVGKKFISWEKDVSKVLPVNERGKIKDVGYLFFHNIFKTADGKVFAIGEQYRKAASGWGIAANVLGGGNSNVGMAKIVVEDLYVMQFSADFTLESVKVFDKTRNDIEMPGGSEYVSPQLLAYMVKAYDGFDYSFTQMNKDKSVYSVGYLDWSRNAKSMIFGAVTWADNEFSTDQLKLKTEASSLRVFPGKPGYVMVSEYFRKQKKLETRLEKINY